LSFAIGLASIWWLVRWLRQGRLHLFAWWVIPLGVAVVAWQLL
jgi:undecaprenyl-diphosphatase